jgi:hypothetical protein
LKSGIFRPLSHLIIRYIANAPIGQTMGSMARKQPVVSNLFVYKVQWLLAYMSKLFF